MTDFASLGLAEPILRAVAAEGYETPTPIQAEAIPLLIDGHDLVGIAQTGAGKTAAFVLPLLHRIEKMRAEALADGRKGGPAPRTCRVLILAPTRELATQIGDCIRSYGRFLRPSVAIVLGGVKPGPQIKALSQGQEIIVATPGRLLDHVGAGALRLEQTEAVVLDEADQMMDLGFLPGIRKIMARLPHDRQTVLLSATMPKQIRSLADDFLNNPREVAVAQQSRPVERIEQKVLPVSAGDKLRTLVDLLREPEVTRAIVFTRTKRGAEKVSNQLNAAGLMSEAIHGDKSQGQRERALAAFRGNKAWVLVATDIAARGIDIDGISHVFNYELPNVPESYVHRIGRTARAGASGVAVSLCDQSERPLLRDIERLIGMTLLPREPREQRARRPQPDARRSQGYAPASGLQSAGDEHREPAPRRHAPGARGPAHGDERSHGSSHEHAHHGRRTHEHRPGEGRHGESRNGEGRHYEGRRFDSARSEGGPRRDGQRHEGQRHEGQRHEGARDGQRHEGAREGQRHEGQRRDAGRPEGQRHEGRPNEGRRFEGGGAGHHDGGRRDGRSEGRRGPPRGPSSDARVNGGDRAPRRERAGDR